MPKPASTAANVFKSATQPLGILGGGQLARMMALKAHELGVPVAILSERGDDPAAQVIAHWHQGDLKDPSALERFLKSCSVATFESEFLDAELLAKLARKTGVEIFPRPHDMALIQDRRTQKELLTRHHLPTADFMAVSTTDDARKAWREFDKRVVFKKRRFGYDGYGTFVVRSAAELESFLDQLASDTHGFIAERFVPFRREIAIMIARGRNGRTLHLPFVETKQEDARCLWVKGPLKTNPELTKLAKKLERFLQAIDYVGVMGVELFDLGTTLLINELAPRVHNSGHYSLDALSEDQFTIHLKCVLGLDLVTPLPLAKGFAMMNLLGQSTQSPSWRLPADVSLHWYGKKENRPGRKMGHINALAATPERALTVVKKRRSQFKV